MQDLSTYVNENINEGLLSWLKAVWHWLFGSKELKYEYGKHTALPELTKENTQQTLPISIKLDLQEIKFEVINSKKIFDKIITLTNPNKAKHTGLYYFQQIMNRPEYKDFGVKPWKMNCIVITDSTFRNTNSAEKNIFGLATYSCECPLQDNDGILLLDYELLPQIDSYDETLTKLIKFLEEKGKEKHVKYIRIAIDNNDIEVNHDENDDQFYIKQNFTKEKGEKIQYWQKEITNERM